MKLLKIMVWVLAVLLVVSLAINIFVLAGFRIVNSNTYTQANNVSQNANNEAQNESENENKKPEKNKHNKHNKHNSAEGTSTEETEEEAIRELVYQDKNITVTYCGIKEDSAELTYLFEIENTSDKTLNISFDNLLINGQRVYISGLTCEKLLPGSVDTEDFVVKEVDDILDPEAENEFTFNIKLMNAKSYLDLYETEQVTVTTV